MKNKVISIVLIILSLCIVPLKAYAEEYKIEDIESHFKKAIPAENGDTNEETTKEFLDKIVTTVEDNNILITVEGEENKNYKRTITLENDILTFYGDERAKDKDYREDMSHLSESIATYIVDAVMVNQMIHAVSLAKGYSDDDFLRWWTLNSRSTSEESSQEGIYIDPSFEKYGFNVVIEEYEKKDENGSVWAPYLISFSIDLNKFNIEENVGSENQGTDPEINQNLPTNNSKPSTSNTNKTDSEIENPQTGEEFPYVLILFGIIGIFWLYFRKKSFIYKL